MLSLSKNKQTKKTGTGQVAQTDTTEVKPKQQVLMFWLIKTKKKNNNTALNRLIVAEPVADLPTRDLPMFHQDKPQTCRLINI